MSQFNNIQYDTKWLCLMDEQIDIMIKYFVHLY